MLLSLLKIFIVKKIAWPMAMHRLIFEKGFKMMNE